MALRFVQTVIICYSVPNPAPVFRNRVKTPVQLQTMAPVFQLNRVPAGHPILNPEAMTKTADDLWRLQIRDRLLSFVDTSVGGVGNLAMISSLMNICCGILQARAQFVGPVVAALADFYQDYTNPPVRFARKSLEHTIQTTMDAILKYDVGPETSLLAKCRSGRIARGRKARELELRRKAAQPHGPNAASSASDVKGTLAKPIFAPPPSSLSRTQTSEALTRIISGLRTRLAKPNSNLYSGFALATRLAATLPLEDTAFEKLFELIEVSAATTPGQGLVSLWANAEYSFFLRKSNSNTIVSHPKSEGESEEAKTFNLHAERYKQVANIIFEKMATSEFLPNVLRDLPEIPETVFESLANRVRTSRSADLYISTLKDITLQRPSYRQKALDLLLDFTNDENDLLLPKLISPFKELMTHSSLSQTIVDYARDQMERIFEDEDIIRREEEIKLISSGTNTSAGASTSVDGSANALSSSLNDMQVTTESLVPRAEQPLSQMQVSGIVKRYMSLYLGLYSERRELLNGAVDVYSRLHAEEVRAGISREILYRVRVGGADDPVVLNLIVDHAPESEKLALDLCEVNGPTPALTQAVMSAASSGKLDGRFIACVFPGLTREQAYTYFPKLLTLPQPTLRKITSLTLSQVAGGKFPLSPEELLVQLHLARLPNGAEALKEAAGWINMLFDDPSQAILKPDVLFPALISIVQTTPLPVLFFRTLLISINRLKAMESYALTLLTRPEIMEKNVWADDRHRIGFINACEKLLPGSISLVLNLPLDRFENVLKVKPTIKEAIRLRIQAGQVIPFDKQPFFKDNPSETEADGAASTS